MNAPLQKILVPVDFTINTNVAIQKALFLSQDKKTTVHLLHVLPLTAAERLGFRRQFPGGSMAHVQDAETRIAVERLFQLEQKIAEFNLDISVRCHVLRSRTVEAAIIEKAGETRADLVLIGKNSRHVWFPFLNKVRPGFISGKSKIPVLTFKPGAINYEFRTIVLPLGKKFPGKKIAAIDALKYKGLTRIRLLAFKSDEGSDQLSKVLFHVYRLLRQATVAEIDYTTISDASNPATILEFCNKTDADLLIISQETETMVNWMNRQIFDLVKKESKTQILTV